MSPYCFGNFYANYKEIAKKSCPNCTVRQKKKVRSERGVPETIYGEIKKVVSFSLTPQAQILLKQLSQELNISASELLERVARSGTTLKPYLQQNIPSTKLPESLLEELSEP